MELSKIMIPILVIFAISLLPAVYAENMGSIAVTFTYTNGDTADYWPISLKIYQNFDTHSYKEISSISGNPFNIISLPINHKYKIEAYSNDLLSGIGYVDLSQLHQDVNMPLPLPGGMRVNAFYNDGLTPIDNSTIMIKSKYGKVWSHGLTDVNGRTMRFWLEPTSYENDYYVVDVHVGNNLNYSQSQIFLRPGIPQEIHIQTPWPPVINSLVTVNVLNSTKPIMLSQNPFKVILLDSYGKQIRDSQVTSRGTANFYNLKVGDYFLNLINTNDNSKWGFLPITLDGTHLSFDLPLTAPTTSVPIGDTGHIPVLSLNNTVPTATPRNGSIGPVISIPSTTIPSPTISSQIKNKTHSGLDKINCKCVAFRLDNVQDYWLDDVQEQIIDKFDKNNVGLTVGIIGGAFGNDSKIINAIKMKSDHKLIDIGINGWNFEDFTTYTRQDQSYLIGESKNTITQQLGISPDIFIPPYGKSNNDTLYALTDNSIYLLSGNVDMSIFPNMTKNIHVLPATVFSGLSQYVSKNQSNSITLAEIDSSVHNNGYAIVTINFQDYAKINGTTRLNSPDESKIDSLQVLINDVKNKGYHIVTISNIVNSSDVPEFDILTPVVLLVSIFFLLLLSIKFSKILFF